MKAKIVVIGSFNADLTTYVPRLPRPGETIIGSKFVIGPGGKGSNQAIAAARLGADVTFVGCVGQDAFARIALDMWEKEGVNTRYVTQNDSDATGVAPIMVEESGENLIAVAPGCNMLLTPDHIQAAEAEISQAQVVVTQLEVRLECTHYALELAKQKGAKTILNPAPASPVPATMLKWADFVTPNETELEVITSDGLPTIEARAKSLLTTPQQAAVVTLGAQGAQWVTQQTVKLIPAFKVDVVDTTGAGDAFNGGLAVALAEGKDIEAAIRFANATAALCVTKPGTAPSMPYREEVEALLKRS
jgi:ribokinase